jgi:LysM repeat protein
MPDCVRRWAALGLGLVLAACAEGGPGPELAATGTLLPWRTPTLTPSPAQLEPTQPATVETGPSPTPLTHVVQAKDTLLTIAAQYGVTLDALLALNPDLNPNLLSIGQAILIPGPEGEPITSLVPTATAIPLAFSPIACAPTATGGLVCLTSVQNPTQAILEGLSARIDLLDARGESLGSAVAFAPLNLLPPDEVMPLSVYFPPPAPAALGARASGLTGFQANEVESRYRTLSVHPTQETQGAGGNSWTVEGEVVLDPGAPGPAERLLVLAVGLEDSNQVVGYAVWEAPSAPDPGESVPFSITVLSLFGPIEHVRLMAEALAAPSAP